MAVITGIRFKETGRTYYFSPGELEIKLGEMERMALKIIKQNPNLTIKEIADAMDKEYNSAEVAVRSLRKKGIIKRAGSRKSGYWEIIK